MKMNKKTWSWMVALLGPLIVAGFLSADPAYPVKVGPTRRHLLDQTGLPCLISGDSPQAVSCNSCDDHILWMHGNDYAPNPSTDVFVAALASGIRERDTRHLHTLELNRFSTSRDAEQLASVIGVDLDAAYSDVFMVGQVLKAYNRPNSLPTFTVEAGYEFQMASTLALRAQEYWVLLSGAAGQLYGNDYTWPFVPGWQAHLATPGSVQMTYVKALF